LSISLLEKYIPTQLLPDHYVPTLHRTLIVASVAALLLCAISLANWVLDWRYASKSLVDQKMKSLFPDERRRREYLLEKLDEIDRSERTRQQGVMRREFVRGLVQDAVMLEREMEVGAFD